MNSTLTNLDQIPQDLELIATGDGDGLLKIRGPLDFTSVPRIASDIPALIAGRKQLTLDLSGVTTANSAGLALLLELKRLERNGGCSLQFQHLPKALANIIRISELTEMFASNGN